MTFVKSLRAGALLCALLLCVACRQVSGPKASDITLDLSADSLRVGVAMMTLRVTDKEGAPLMEHGKLTLRGDMNHAGMTPVIAESSESEGGVFRLPFDWTMGGAWQVEARLELPNGEVASQTFRYEIASGGAERTDDGQGADMEMGASDLPGANSAAYMRIRNHSASDIALVAVESDASQSASFHHTQVIDGIARMIQLRELVAPANGEVALAPGGMHLMLQGLTRDLSPDSRFGLTLTDSEGKSYRMPILVSEQAPARVEDGTRIHDLSFEGRWARPGSGG